MKVLFTVSVSTTAVLDLLIRILSAPNKILCVPLVTVTNLHTIMYQLQGYYVWPLNIISRPLIVLMTSISHLLFVTHITTVMFPFICKMF